MAQRNSTDVGFFLVGGHNLLSSLTSFSDKIAWSNEETTPLGVAFPEHTQTALARTTLTQDGFYDDATAGANDALLSHGASSQVGCYGLEGNTLGSRMVGFSGLLGGDFERLVQVDKVHKAKATYVVTANRDEGVILQPLAAKTTAGNTEATSVNSGASSAAGGAGYLQVNALTLGGYTNLVVKIRHSADNNTFADLLSFTAVTGAPTAERKTCAGTVNQYLATSHAWTGSGTGMTATYMVGFARG